MEVDGYKIEPGADLKLACLFQANLREANLKGVNLAGANLGGSDDRER